jgi:hypothetical protein
MNRAMRPCHHRSVHPLPCIGAALALLCAAGASAFAEDAQLPVESPAPWHDADDTPLDHPAASDDGRASGTFAVGGVGAEGSWPRRVVLPDGVVLGVAFAETTGNLGPERRASPAVVSDAAVAVTLSQCAWGIVQLEARLSSQDDAQLAWRGLSTRARLAIPTGSGSVVLVGFGGALIGYDANSSALAATDTWTVFSTSLELHGPGPGDGATRTVFRSAYEGNGPTWRAEAALGAEWSFTRRISLDMTAVWAEAADLSGDGPRIHTIARGGRLALHVRF